MKMGSLLFYLSLILSGFIIFLLAVSNKKKLTRNKDILSGTYPKEKANKEPQGNKNKQQVELEQLLITNNKLLNTLNEVDKNIKLKLFITLLLTGIYVLFNPESDRKELAIAGAVIFVLTILIPGSLANMILKRKIKNMMTDLPSFVDLVAICVQTGMTINAALLRVAEDFKVLNPDLSYVMLRVIRKAEIVGLLSALDTLAVSLPTREIRMFTTVLQQSLNFGSSIYGHLLQLSSDMRELQLLTIEEHLGTLSAKMSVPLIIFIMFPIIILIVAPGVMRVFPNV
ncbi:type II secretion system F family protein [Bisgaard Taxon 10/6]|uniref:type II secretion system F family protein n=1 Tax=Exercitatus varius TaxID=67857 RepID=UPI00294AD4C2|nr:type II secretion system F family protein [Exercitatus varius]MDG2915283.1 type II secretion system F family protein [Exercitatus varius]MDG2918519.1 type II secretion system F family protein [Exercitatus varius]MDG2955110.1 type II secretion system F family protein [Exercitatus varius]MDG2957074.1 type II secretion system F family protein [Exercitatus varius]MDG2957306.1 type II secretion system F family protein [Exercitatus varius]